MPLLPDHFPDSSLIRPLTKINTLLPGFRLFRARRQRETIRRVVLRLAADDGGIPNHGA